MEDCWSTWIENRGRQNFTENENNKEIPPPMSAHKKYAGLLTVFFEPSTQPDPIYELGLLLGNGKKKKRQTGKPHTSKLQKSSKSSPEIRLEHGENLPGFALRFQMFPRSWVVRKYRLGS